jgi:hypothetical protein
MMTTALCKDVHLIIRLSPFRLAAHECDREAHRRIRFGTMPMPLAGLDMHDIADSDRPLVVLSRHHADVTTRT